MPVPRRTVADAGRAELGLGIIGAGRWGKRLLRVFSATPGARVVGVCDSDPSRLKELKRFDQPFARFSNVEALLAHGRVDAVVIATPSSTHARLVLLALDAGKDVFVEKPMATELPDALSIHGRVQSAGRRLMVGHVLEYHPSVARLVALIRAGALGELRFVCCERFGLAQSSVSDPWWELAPHDFSLIRLLTGQEPRFVAARRTGPELIDAVVGLPSRVRARISVGRSELRPKSRTTLVAGTEAVAVFQGVTGQLDLLLPRVGLRDWLSGFAERWARADLTAELAAQNLTSQHCFSSSIEPLAVEAGHFVSALLGSTEIRTDAEGGLRVVSALCAGERSLAQGGRPIDVSAHPLPRRTTPALAHEPAVEL